ncbi:MAG: aminotransferase class I/II-fold pyridoxal phosphate-dependent enzyme [Chloroflexota bacterium]
MLPEHTPTKVKQAFEAMLSVNQFMGKYSAWLEAGGSDVCDFAVGNPHEMPLPEFVQALEKATAPKDKDWYGYKFNESQAVDTVAASLTQQFDQPFDPEDIFMTNGATGALDVVFKAILEEDDEVIFNSPPWFFYEGMVLNTGGIPVRVKIDPQTFDLDLVAIKSAITHKTRLIIVNSPNNPTGKVYPPETLQALAQLLSEASQMYGRTIYLLSDEAYRRILYDGHQFFSPTTYYAHSFMVYTYGKTLLTPGQRLGYIALPPTMPNREQMRMTLFSAQILNGFATSNAILQHALPEIETLSIDIEHLQQKRDRLVSALREIGYEVHMPEGTFYLLPRSPIDDDIVFTDLLATKGVFCLPGNVVEMPGYFRISLTANDQMTDRAIPKFAAAFAEADRI